MDKELDGNSIEKSCPNCGVSTRLIIRKNRARGNYFVGCPNWPDCDHTEGLSEERKMRAEGHPTMF